MSDSVQELLDVIALRQSWAPSRRKAARTGVEVSLREMAEALGTTHTAVRHWEIDGGTNPQTRELERRYYDLLIKLEEMA